MSTSQPPADYTSLVDARSKDGIYVNVMGKVVDYMPPKQTSGSDWFCTFRLQDPSVAASFNVETSLGLRVRYFANESKHRLMPRINSLGDVVILRSVKCTTRSSEKMLISNPGTICAVIPKNNFPSEPYQDAFVAVTRPLDFLPTQPYGPLTPAEQLYAMHLHNNLDASISVFPASSRSLPSGPSGGAAPERPTMKFGLIEDLRISQFRDLVVEVVKIFPTNMWTDLYVTDYTSNELLQDRAAPDDISDSRAITSDPYGYIDSQGRKWQGPHGKLTLKIELRYPHDNYANSYVKPGDFVSLENVRVKQDGSGKLEGNMWQDRYKPERVQIEKLDGKHSRKMQHQQLHSLKLRKEQYLASLPKTTAPEDVEIKSKGVKKRERREKRKRAQEEREQERKRVEASFHDTDGLQAFAFVNKHVQCSNHSIGMTSIGTILDFEYLQNETPSGIKRSLPFLNAKYRSQVRVVDYYPDKLEDFARSLDNKSYNDVPDSENEDSDIMGIDTVPPKRWEWAFYILVEDAKKAKAGARSAYLPLTVSGSDAEYLLKLDATDLRRDRDNLASLREKLFILWGDLQEVKEKAMHGEQVEPNESGSTGYACSSRPFECCIMEYGMPSPSAADNEMNPEKNWTRTFKMFGTTIMN